MKKCWLALILILALCVVLSGCDASKLSPWGEKSVENKQNQAKTFSVYVYGAVKNEGYCQVIEGDTYFQAIVRAGLLDQSKSTPDFYAIVTENKLSVAVHYEENGVSYECVNVNGKAIELRLDVPNVSSEVVDRIADYIENHGKIRNKTQLYAVLGDDYYENYYKLYVAEADYEAVH